jgi:DNA (cytosine-5)-methyltransferase 1
MHRASKTLTRPKGRLRVCELFAGVGGFHLGLARAGFEVVWANQWEPGTTRQHAFECYERHFPGLCVNRDIGLVIDEHQKGALKGVRAIPEHDVLVGGFPCQDYSVAKPLSLAAGIDGRKGVLWWQIERWLYHFRPSFLFLENVDRLLNSPSSRRGRDFAVMLSCLARLGYEIEWRVVNAADYGLPQKRRRVFIVGRHASVIRKEVTNPFRWIIADGVFAESLPVRLRKPSPTSEAETLENAFPLDPEDRFDPYRVTHTFGHALKRAPFRNAGYMRDGRVWTVDVAAAWGGPFENLGQWLQANHEVPKDYWISERALPRWKYLKGPKAERRIHPKTKFEYFYSEGGIPYPDRIDGPARTILTGEGGATPSRFKHIVRPPRCNRYRRLTPVELERLNGFPDDWTAGMPDGRRAFCMGNALVVGVVERIGRVIASRNRASMLRAVSKSAKHPSPARETSHPKKPRASRRSIGESFNAALTPSPSPVPPLVLPQARNGSVANVLRVPRTQSLPSRQTPSRVVSVHLSRRSARISAAKKRC